MSRLCHAVQRRRPHFVVFRAFRRFVNESVYFFLVLAVSEIENVSAWWGVVFTLEEVRTRLCERKRQPIAGGSWDLEIVLPRCHRRRSFFWQSAFGIGQPRGDRRRTTRCQRSFNHPLL